jgi:hypothetical protein
MMIIIIVTTTTITTVHKSLPSVWVCMCIPLSLLGNGSTKRYHGNKYTRNNGIIIGRVVFYTVCVISKAKN